MCQNWVTRGLPEGLTKGVTEGGEQGGSLRKKPDMCQIGVTRGMPGWSRKRGTRGGSKGECSRWFTIGVPEGDLTEFTRGRFEEGQKFR